MKIDIHEWTMDPLVSPASATLCKLYDFPHSFDNADFDLPS